MKGQTALEELGLIPTEHGKSPRHEHIAVVGCSNSPTSSMPSWATLLWGKKE